MMMTMIVMMIVMVVTRGGTTSIMHELLIIYIIIYLYTWIYLHFRAQYVHLKDNTLHNLAHVKHFITSHRHMQNKRI